MDYIRINDWDEWQTYRKDRGTPPWIKVYRNLMSSPKWAALSDAEKGQLVSIWIVAADSNGVVTSDARTLRKICQLDDTPNIDRLVEVGWVTQCGRQPDAKLTPQRRQDDAPETEAEPEIEKELLSQPLGSKTPKGGEGGVSKNRNGEFNILGLLSEDGLASARRAAEGWDIYRLADIYNKGIGKRDGPPRSPDKAFAGWCAKYTKGKAPA